MTKYVDYGEGNYKSDRQLSSTSYRDTRRTNSSSSDAGHFGGFRVYVGDIGQRIGRTDLEREFGQYGPVTDVWMGRKREPTSQNYAFVVYRYPEDAEEAVRDRNGRKVCGRKVRVEHAKPVNSNPRRHRGSWDYRGRGDYNSSRGGGQQRRRSRERYSTNRRSRSLSPVRTSRGQQSPGSNRNDSFSDSSPKKSLKRSASSSPDPKLKKSKKSKKEISASPSPTRQNQHAQDSDSGSLSSTPPPKKKKKKPKQRGQSSSQSPEASDEYDARQYQKSQDGRGDGRKIRPSKNKKKNIYNENDGYSSDDN